MREKQVTLGGTTIILREHKVGELRKKVLPAITETFASINLNASISELADESDKLFALICKIIPDVTPEMLEEAHMSELEDLIQGWVDVNFQGFKTFFKQLLSSPTPGRS